MIQASTVRAYYDRTAPYYDITRRPLLLGRGAARRLLSPAPDHDVLEIGAGTGHNLPGILSAIGNGRLTLVDFSVRSLHFARRKAPPHSRVLPIASDARHLPLRAGFDRILFSYSLSLMDDPQDVLSQARTCLKPGGRLVVADFGPMDRWGPLRRGVHWWLDKHSVRPVDVLLRDAVTSAGPGSFHHTAHFGYTILASIQATGDAES